jgi:hypothetical protein
MCARGSILVTFVALVGVVGACSSATPDTVVLQASGGLDGAAFAGTPPIAKVELRVRPQGGSETTVATSDASSGGVDVPDSVRSNGGIGALALVGLDGSGSILAYGRTPDVEFAGLDQDSVGITILVQRVGAVERAMQLQRVTTARPMVVPYGPRFVLVADSAKGTLERIDLLTSSAASESLVLPGPPVTIAAAGDALLSIDAAGNGSILHPGDTETSTATPPDGASFSDVAGAAVVVGDDESAYVVGGTRALPSDLVLRLGSDGTIAGFRMSVARSGGAAAWWPGHGLVLIGGAKVDSSAPPVELLAIKAPSGTPLAFPPDGTKGAIVTSDGGNKIVRVAASGVVDVFDLSFSCSAPPCAPTVQSAHLSGDARVDDVITARDRGGFVVVRGGSISLLDAALTTVTPLGPVGDSIGAALVPTGVTVVVDAGDAVVRTVY